MADWHAEEGTVAGFVAVLAVGLIAVAGLAYDGGSIITATAHARDVAAGAARAGAQAADIAQVHAGHTGLDTDAAHERATAFLDAAGVAGTVDVQGATVTVTVTVTQPMRILPIADRKIVATHTATAVSDVLQGDLP